MSIPTVNHDASGYFYEGRFIEGFADDPNLPPKARMFLARLAVALDPDNASPAQREIVAAYLEDTESRHGIPTDDGDRYTDANLLEQIEAECQTALDMGFVSGPAATMVSRFIEKIDAQRRGERWWEL